jgi:hypothetical protein
MKFVNNRSIRSLFGMLVVVAVTGSLFGQKLAGSVKGTKTVTDVVSAPNASVTPVVFDGQNISCADLNALYANGSGDIRFSHIISNNELKLDFADPNGTYPFTTGNGRIVVGPQDVTKSVTIVSSSNPGVVSSWSSQRPVTAVNVKVGNTSYVYPYKPFRISDTDLATGDNRGISHVTFCFDDSTGPTAGEAAITGRVVNASGIGISKAQLILVNGATGETKITMTNPFGYYSITGLDVNELYVLNVSHKRFIFAEPQRTINLTDSFTTLDFVAEPSQ